MAYKILVPVDLADDHPREIRFARELASPNNDVVAAAILRPGYMDPEGNRSEGRRGQSTGDNWKTFILNVFGDRFEPNCRRCPQTAELLQQVPHLRNAGLSILAPHYRIPPHRGPTNGIIRVHLALQIPADSENCWIRVDDRVLNWKQGECIIFDDHYEHEVQNNTDEERVVLFFDVDRPMRLPGWLLTQSLLSGFKHSAYVRDTMKILREREGQH